VCVYICMCVYVCVQLRPKISAQINHKGSIDFNADWTYYHVSFRRVRIDKYQEFVTYSGQSTDEGYRYNCGDKISTTECFGPNHRSSLFSVAQWDLKSRYSQLFWFRAPLWAERERGRAGKRKREWCLCERVWNKDVQFWFLLTQDWECYFCFELILFVNTGTGALPRFVGISVFKVAYTQRERES
jgi:hypothetical protein